MPRSSALRVGLASAFVLATFAVICPPAGAQEEDISEFPEGVQKAEVAGVSLEPGDAGVGSGGEPVTLLGAKMKQEPDKNERTREFHIGRSFGESMKDAGFEAAVAKAEIRSSAGGEQARYAEWIRGISGLEIGATALATLRLTQFESKLEVAAPKTVTAGEPIRLYVKSVGGADSKWRVSLVLPDSSETKWDVEKMHTGAVKVDSRLITAGKEVLGGRKGKIKVIRFDTYPADGGKLLGLLVEEMNHEQFQHVFWVAVSEAPPRMRIPPPELPADHPLADPMVRNLLGDVADIAEENWWREQLGAAAAP